MIPVGSASPEALIDTCGTGGGAVTTFNISTAAALVARGAGARIAKHGNRSFTSRSGSADVLEALDVRIELTLEEMERVLDEAGLVFMFAPLLHPAMRHVGPVRRELGFPTIMNILGPLTNPAGVRRQLVGVADPALVPLVVEALKELGHVRALVVHGEAGLDELSPMGPTAVAELRDGTVSQRTVRPEDFGLKPCAAEELEGGEPEDNARIILNVLRGEERGGARTAIVLNAAAALYVADIAETLEAGTTAARAAVDDGSALEALENLREASRPRD
jgi:anthranilate phosphoribosyltransferase